MKRSLLLVFLLGLVALFLPLRNPLYSLAIDGDDDTPITPKKNEFLPGLWQSVKKGLSDEELEEQAKEEVEEGLEFEDPVNKTWQERLAEIQEKTLKQDYIAKASRAAKELAIDWARKEVNKSLDNRCASSLVRVRNTLSSQEKEFRANRFGKVKNALESFLGEDVDDETVRNATIAFVGTGGGYRAMTLTAGYLSGLEKCGLLDALTYAAGLSGSTWTLGPWISQGGSIQNFKQQLQSKITNNKFNIMRAGPGILSSTKNITTIVDTILWPKFLWNQPIRSVDFFGFLLGQVLLGDDGYKKHLSDQWNMVRAGNYPFPLYTAISMSKKNGSYSYDWYEFNPAEVRVNFKPDADSPDHYLTVPICSFGSQFDAGKTVAVGNVTVAPEQIFGYWLGTFGSAFTINPKDLNDFMDRAFAKFDKSLLSLEGIKFFTAAALVGVVKEVEGIGKARISPAQIFNPFKNYSEAPSWLQVKKYLTLIDAGVAYNIPVKPLLWPERKVKFIIIGESSAAVESAAELKKFFEDAQRSYGYHYERVDDGKNATIRFYKDKNDPKAPRIIYITYLKDPKVFALTGPEGVEKLTAQEKIERQKLQEFIRQHKLENFDPLKCISSRGGMNFCGTFNFEYSVDDFRQLSGMAEFNVRVNKEVIAEFIRDELHNEGLADYPGWGNP